MESQTIQNCFIHYNINQKNSKMCVVYEEDALEVLSLLGCKDPTISLCYRVTALIRAIKDDNEGRGNSLLLSAQELMIFLGFFKKSPQPVKTLAKRLLGTIEAYRRK